MIDQVSSCLCVECGKMHKYHFPPSTPKTPITQTIVCVTEGSDNFFLRNCVT